jgi:hypothetical protein
MHSIKSSYDGVGEYAHLHADIEPVTVARATSDKSGFVLRCIREVSADRAVEYVYGEIDPLTRKMAENAAERWITGKAIPRTIEMR